MRHTLHLILVIALAPAMVHAQTITGTIIDTDWQLLAIDGQFFEANVVLRIEEGGTVSGTAPCNHWSSTNAATLPTLDLKGIRATRMACDRLADEQAFFDALVTMDRLDLAGPKNLILTGPDGHSMEFSLASISSSPDCKTCPPKT